MDALPSLIWACVIGLSVGNYATSFVFRMPRAESPFTKHPYCGGCGTMLAPKDLFPALSWLWLKGRCRYCAMEIPSVYFWVEILCAAVFMTAWFSYGWSEEYLLVVTGGTVAATLWGLERQTGRIFHSVLLLLAALGLVYRTLLDGTTIDALYGMIWGATLPMFWWRIRLDKSNTNGEKERLVIPPSVALGATAGIWLASFGLLVFVCLWLALLAGYHLLARVWTACPQGLRTVPFLLALMLLVLFPQVVTGLQEASILHLREALGITPSEVSAGG